ncbi:MAG: hypothetical protein PHU23_08200, partial [Dehalococcoidales bacterium]|nr:hypothetical protein [Dehalococcoidales bacterium]
TSYGQRDVESIALHALGHALGLAHLHGDYPGYPQDTDKIMYGSGMSEGRNQRSLGSGDIAGIRWIYPEVQAQYTITASAGPGGSISPSGIIRVEPGSSQSFSIQPNTGHVISDVRVDGDSIGPVDTYSFLNIDADHTIEVIFSPEECTLTINITGEGEVSRNTEGPYRYGQVIRLTAEPSPGWRFDHWEGDLSGSDNPVDITMSGLMTVTAVFSLIEDPGTGLSVSTVEASNVGSAGAILNGRLVSMGDNDAVEVYFEWGPSQEYGQTTEPQELAEPGNFSRLITGLEAGKTCHYRAVAVGQEGVITGSDASFIPRVRPSGGGGGGGSRSSSRTISLKGLTSSPTLVTDNSGAARSSVQLKDSNGKVILDIVKGTSLKDSLNKALRTISARILSPDEWETDEYPLHEIVPDGRILEEYLFEPGGAMFNPALTLKVSYDPVGLPGGVDEGGLYLAGFIGTRWEKLDSQVDIGFHTVSAKINHFSRYALVGHIPPPAPASFSLSPVRVLPDTTSPESPVKVLAMVSNTGGMPGAYLAVLKVDGMETDAKLIYLEAGQNAAVEFILQRDIPAAYQVEINGNPASFTIISPPIPKTSVSPAQGSAFISAQGDVNKPGTSAADKRGKPLPDTGTAFFVLWIIIAVVILVGMVAGAIITRRRAF